MEAKRKRNSRAKKTEVHSNISHSFISISISIQISFNQMTTFIQCIVNQCDSFNEMNIFDDVKTTNQPVKQTLFIQSRHYHIWMALSIFSAIERFNQHIGLYSSKIGAIMHLPLVYNCSHLLEAYFQLLFGLLESVKWTECLQIKMSKKQTFWNISYCCMDE